MIDGSAGGALMIKTLEEAWELIESVADNHQCFKTRATSTTRGVYEIAPSESTHFGICSCNSHHTDECPQLQDDNVIASSHNYYDGPPPNRQYQQQSQGWRDNQQGRWNSNQQPEYRQPYNNNNPPQNSQNSRYQPPHSRQPYPSNTNSQPSYEDTIRAFHQESKEMRDATKRTEAQISHLTDLLTKLTIQVLPSTSTPPPPPNPSPLPSQPLPNPKGGGINVVKKGDEEKEERRSRIEWLLELMAEVDGLVDPDDEDWWDESDEEDEEDSKEEEEEWEIEEEDEVELEGGEEEVIEEVVEKEQV
ncbi:hypothetical protein PIB30_090613, partial [Stylosanthes scabra]|nr:hypothetical protein [Stylosanthes scabra]